MLSQPLMNRAIRPLGLFAFPFVFWLTSPESIFHLNFMETKWVINDPNQNLGTCWLSFSQDFQGKAGIAETSIQRGEEARSWRTELSNPKDICPQTFVQRSTMVSCVGSHPASPLRLNLFEIYAGALGISQL